MVVSALNIFLSHFQLSLPIFDLDKNLYLWTLRVKDRTSSPIFERNEKLF